LVQFNIQTLQTSARCWIALPVTEAKVTAQVLGRLGAGYSLYSGTLPHDQVAPNPTWSGSGSSLRGRQP